MATVDANLDTKPGNDESHHAFFVNSVDAPSPILALDSYKKPITKSSLVLLQSPDGIVVADGPGIDTHGIKRYYQPDRTIAACNSEQELASELDRLITVNKHAEVLLQIGSSTPVALDTHNRGQIQLDPDGTAVLTLDQNGLQDELHKYKIPQGKPYRFSLPSADVFIINDGKKAVFSKLTFQENTPAGYELVPTERVTSLERAFTRLQKDFPWLTKDDLFDADSTGVPLDVISQKMIQKRQLLDKNPHLHDGLPYFDKKRYARMYDRDGGRYHEIMTTPINEAELFYITSRNYIHSLELATVLAMKKGGKEIASYQDLKTLLASLTAQERKIYYTDFEHEKNAEIERLMKPMWDLEQRLFSVPLTKHIGQSNVYYISDSDFDENMNASGLYFNGKDYAINANDPDWYKDDYQDTIKKIAHVEAHEMRHIGFSEKGGNDMFEMMRGRKKWLREEAWTEMGVLFALGDEKPPFNSVYRYKTEVSQQDGKKVTKKTDQKGGAQMLLDMINESLTIVRDHPDGRITEDDIYKSIIATALQREERGSIFVGIDHGVNDLVDAKGFADMYESLTGKKFDELMQGSNDDDYRALDSEKENPHAKEYEKLYDTFLSYIGDRLKQE